MRMLAADDEDAFTMIHQRYRPVLYQEALKYLSDPAECEDLVQNIFIFLWHKRHSLVIVTSLRSYLKGALRNQALSRWRYNGVRRRYQEFLLADPVEPFTCTNAIDTMIQEGNIFHRLMKMISFLPERCKTAFRLSQTECLSNREIASRMNISLRTVENYISLVQRHLRKGIMND